VHDRAVLLRIVREQQMVQGWAASRPPLLRLKDDLRARVLGPLKPSQIEDALVEMLDRQLHLTVHDEIVTISCTWSDPRTLVEIVKKAQDAFIEARHRADVDSYSDSYQILSASADTARAEVDKRLKSLELAQAEAKRLRTETTLARSSEIANLDGLRGRVLDQIRYREELEQLHAKKLADLKLRLTQQELTLGAQHPDIIATRAELAQVSSQDEPDLSRARADEERLTRMYVAEGGSRAELERSPLTGGERMPLASLDEDYAVINARTLLAIESDHYQTLVSRLADTKLEMETAVAAFPGRFTVVSPPKWPRRPYQPNVPFVLGGGLLAGLLSGSLAAVLLEMRRRANAGLILSTHVATAAIERSEVG
jgi:uncharacterized protein involved in exopolysaccharide biosynthesis